MVSIERFVDVVALGAVLKALSVFYVCYTLLKNNRIDRNFLVMYSIGCFMISLHFFDEFKQSRYNFLQNWLFVSNFLSGLVTMAVFLIVRTK